MEERPPAPWGSFPLVELASLVAIVIGIAGLVIGGNRGRTMLGLAAALGSLAGLELSAREHFAGFRSHSALLGGTAAVAIMAALFFAGAPTFLLPPLGAAVFGVGFWLLRGTFKRRSGGLGFRA